MIADALQGVTLPGRLQSPRRSWASSMKPARYDIERCGGIPVDFGRSGRSRLKWADFGASPRVIPAAFRPRIAGPATNPVGGAGLYLPFCNRKEDTPCISTLRTNPTPINTRARPMVGRVGAGSGGSSALSSCCCFWASSSSAPRAVPCPTADRSAHRHPRLWHPQHLRRPLAPTPAQRAAAPAHRHPQPIRRRHPRLALVLAPGQRAQAHPATEFHDLPLLGGRRMAPALRMRRCNPDDVPPQKNGLLSC